MLGVSSPRMQRRESNRSGPPRARSSSQAPVGRQEGALPVAEGWRGLNEGRFGFGKKEKRLSVFKT